jgi:hypothetical protein
MTQQVNEILQGFTQDQIDTLYTAVTHCVGKEIQVLTNMLEPHISVPAEELWEQCEYNASIKALFDSEDVLSVDIHLGGHLAAL